MAYYSDGVTYVGKEDTGAGVVLWANTTRTTKAVQLYLSGRLTAWQMPVGGSVWFELPVMLPTDTLFLLAVDPANADTDYFADAYTVSATNANRIRIRTPRIQGYELTDRWRVYRGDAGDASADMLVYEGSYYDNRQPGFGFRYGEAFGYGPGTDGFGAAFGYAWGFGCGWLEWTSEPLPPGAYPVQITVVDAAGNESTASADTVTLTTYPRPATDLSITSYDKDTDTLILGWTASPDIT